MTLRKGQHLFNEIEKEFGDKSIREGNLHSIIFYMEDREFDLIMSKLQVKNEDIKN